MVEPQLPNLIHGKPMAPPGAIHQHHGINRLLPPPPDRAFLLSGFRLHIIARDLTDDFTGSGFMCCLPIDRRDTARFCSVFTGPKSGRVGEAGAANRLTATGWRLILRSIRGAALAIARDLLRVCADRTRPELTPWRVFTRSADFFLRAIQTPPLPE